MIGRNMEFNEMESSVTQKGIFITFEGPEGSGKSTHIRLVSEWLKQEGKPVVVTREPGGTAIGSQIRNFLLDPTTMGMAPLTELLLFCADRVQHIEELIAPALKEGTIVLCDRYVDSTIAYQVGGKQLPESLVLEITNISGTSFVPDLTIMLDVNPAIGLTRATRDSTDRFEQESLAFHQRVRAKYLEIAKREPDRVKVVDTTDCSIETVQESIRKIVTEGISDGSH